MAKVWQECLQTNKNSTGLQNPFGDIELDPIGAIW
jgi:hypothetical protein